MWTTKRIEKETSKKKGNYRHDKLNFMKKYSTIVSIDELTKIAKRLRHLGRVQFIFNCLAEKAVE